MNFPSISCEKIIRLVRSFGMRRNRPFRSNRSKAAILVALQKLNEMSLAAEPRLLILETSGRTGEVALARGPVIVQHRLLEETRLHARDLAPAVASMLKAEDWKP